MDYSVDFEKDFNDDRRDPSAEVKGITTGKGPNGLTNLIIQELKLLNFPLSSNICLKKDYEELSDRWESASYMTDQILTILDLKNAFDSISEIREFIPLLQRYFRQPDKFAEKIFDIFSPYLDNGINIYNEDGIEYREQAEDLLPLDEDIFIEDDSEIPMLEDNEAEKPREEILATDIKKESPVINTNPAPCNDESEFNTFSRQDINEIRCFHDAYKGYFAKRVKDRNNRARKDCDIIVKEIKMVGFNNMIHLLYDIKDNKYLENHDLLTFFIFVSLLYTTPLYFELFFMFYSFGSSSNDNPETNTFIPFFDEEIKPYIDDYLNGTLKLSEGTGNIDYYSILENYIVTQKFIKRFDNQKDIFLMYRENMKKEGLKAILKRFYEYSKMKNNEYFGTLMDKALLIVHLTFLFEDSWIFAGQTNNSFLIGGREKMHLNRIFDDKEFFEFSLQLLPNRSDTIDVFLDGMNEDENRINRILLNS